MRGLVTTLRDANGDRDSYLAVEGIDSRPAVADQEERLGKSVKFLDQVFRS